ncbi:hypothetical protein, partial [Escherichia coli]
HSPFGGQRTMCIRGRFKAGLRRKMRKAAMDRNYLASVLAGSGLS